MCSHVSVLEAKSTEPAGQARRPRVARREVPDPEARLELGDRRDRAAEVAQAASRHLLELRPQPVERGDRLVHELCPGARPDVDHDLPPDSEQRVGERDREIPAGAELVERRLRDGHARPVLLVRGEVRCRARELLAVRGIPHRERAEDVPLEDVVQPLALRKHSEPALHGSLGDPAHAREDTGARTIRDAYAND